MKTRLISGLAGFLLLPFLGLPSSAAGAAGNFAIAATNVTMPPSDNGTSQYTVTGIPEAGGLAINCTNAGPIDPTTKVPGCWTGLPLLIPVQAGQTVKGTVYFIPPGQAMPGLASGGLLAAGALLFGFGFRRRRQLFRVAVLAVVALAGAAGLSGCVGGGFNGMTPGTYQFTVSAVLAPSAAGAATILTKTTVSVTVP